jgi:hypothetical protein
VNHHFQPDLADQDLLVDQRDQLNRLDLERHHSQLLLRFQQDLVGRQFHPRRDNRGHPNCHLSLYLHWHPEFHRHQYPSNLIRRLDQQDLADQRGQLSRSDLGHHLLLRFQQDLVGRQFHPRRDNRGHPNCHLSLYLHWHPEFHHHRHPNNSIHRLDQQDLADQLIQ